MKPLIDVRPSPMPKSWKDSIRAARAKEVPETAVQLIAAAAARGAIPADGWTGGVEVESLLQQSADEREAGQRRARLSCCGLKEWRERSDA